MATKYKLNPIPVKKPRKPRATTIAKAEAMLPAKLLLKTPLRVPKTTQQARAKLKVEFQVQALKQLEKDKANPKQAKVRKAKEDAKLAKAVLLATPIEKEAYSEALGCEIAERVSNGEHLPDVLKSVDVSFNSLGSWMRKHKHFSVLFQTARETQAHNFISEVVKIVDDAPATMAGIAKAKIQANVRQWLASKILSPIYGERIVHSGDTENPVVTKMVLDSAELMKKLRGVQE